jgi:hypothetical protein
MENSGEQKNKNIFKDTWGSNVTRLGYTQVPNVLLFNIQRLDLKFSDFIFICHILSRINLDAEFPFFSLNKMIRDLKMKKSTLNNVVGRLISKDYLRTYPRRENPLGKGRNDYDISGLIKALQELAAIKLEITAFSNEKRNTNVAYPHNATHLGELLKQRSPNYGDVNNKEK